MVKKILFGTLITFITGALIAGAIIRTQSKAAASAGDPQGQGRGNEAAQGEGSQPNGGRGGNQRSVSNQGAGGGQEQPGDAEAHDWLALEGMVASVDEEALVVVQTDGTEIVIEGRGWQYAQEQRFWTEVGNTVVVRGFYEDAEAFSVAGISDLTTGDSVLVRDETGRPLWAGGNGQGGNRGS